MGDLRPEEFPHVVDRGQRVLDDVVQQTGGYRHVVEVHLGYQSRDLQRVRDVLLAGPPRLAGVLEGRELVGPVQQVGVRIRVVGANRAEQILEADHG